jgi:hypothetical protein
MARARNHNQSVSYAKTLADAVTRAQDNVGQIGTILIAGTQSIIAEAMIIWGKQYEQI